MMRLVILESPYAGDIERNVAYARAAMRDSLRRGEAPLASHLLYTQPGVLDDNDPIERTLGIDAGLEWGTFADATVVYCDLGISKGMRIGMERARGLFRHVVVRYLGAPWSDREPSSELAPDEPPAPLALSAPGADELARAGITPIGSHLRQRR